MVNTFYNWIGSNLFETDKSRRLCQRRSGTDDCEHEFAGTKLRNPKPTQNDMRKHTARRTGTRTSGMFTKLNKANTSGDQALYTDNLITPIMKKTTTEIK